MPQGDGMLSIVFNVAFIVGVASASFVLGGFALLVYFMATTAGQISTASLEQLHELQTRLNFRLLWMAFSMAVLVVSWITAYACLSIRITQLQSL